MRTSRLSPAIIGCFLLLLGQQSLHAQMGYSIEVKKPEPYENRVLKAEKTPTDKKLKEPKRFFQNLTTHFNYHYNASLKLNEIIDRAKQSHRDDYSTLLPFYNYTLDATAQDAAQLDSVIYKSQSAIVSHDLRNDWIDNMYMLWGAAWYFQKKFDSASLMFQYINYAFAEKEKDGYYRFIGSRLDGNNALSIATKENNSFLKRTFSTAPSRNEAFLWQIRSLIEQGDLTESGSLIATLKDDPNFPKRLHSELEEVQAYWFYKQGIWDSSATHLLNALDQARSKQEKGRWEFLAAQMFEKKGNRKQAQELYAKAISHGTDPVMDVYARLNLVRTNTEGGENYIDKNVAELVKMAKRPKYEEYRDVIYYMAAQMEMERNNFAAAQDYMMKAAKHNNGNLSSRSSAFLVIADLAYTQKRYIQAASFYDSIQTKDLAEPESKRVEERKKALAKVVAESEVIRRQDSLQRIAAMPEEERKQLINKLVRQLRKQQGLADEKATLTAGTKGGAASSSNNPPADLFNNPNKGEWYFYNNNAKTQGSNQFKQTWGNRPNVDNWRRFAQVSNQIARGMGTSNDIKSMGSGGSEAVDDNSPNAASLIKRLPLTPEAMNQSNDSINESLFKLGSVYIKEMEDYPSAIEVLEKLRTRLTSYPKMDELLFNLYYAYTKVGDAAKAAEIKALLDKQAGSRYQAIVSTGKDPAASGKGPTQATKDYEAVYDLFIEGRFAEALEAKKRADSLYRTNYWQPQLLYIEAVYHVKQREDSMAKSVLKTLINQDPKSPLAKKAQTMIDVLNRRSQIEDELTRLQIERPADAPPRDTTTPVQQPQVVQQPATPPPAAADTLKGISSQATAQKAADQKGVKGPTIPVLKDTSSTIRPNKVDVAVVPPPVAPKSDTAAKKPVVARRDTAVKKPAPEPVKPRSIYNHDASAKHYAVVVLDKVDAIFVGEARNAFNRYNRERYFNQPLAVNLADLSADQRLLIIGEFKTAQEAVDYTLAAKRLAPNEIIPWLKADKYSFTVIGQNNLETLQTRKDLPEYRKFLDQNLPVKF